MAETLVKNKFIPKKKSFLNQLDNLFKILARVLVYFNQQISPNDFS